jgi:hypothetical protein
MPTSDRDTDSPQPIDRSHRFLRSLIFAVHATCAFRRAHLVAAGGGKDGKPGRSVGTETCLDHAVTA